MSFGEFMIFAKAAQVKKEKEQAKLFQVQAKKESKKKKAAIK